MCLRPILAVRPVNTKCRVSKKEVKTFPLLDLKNQKSEYLKPIVEVLNIKWFETKILKTNYEFQKGIDELLSIKT